jgi:zinc and cadmium transporter
MTLMHILLATFAGGVLSVLLAATLALTWLPRFADRMVAFAVGVLLAFAFIGLLPEATHLGLEPERIGELVLAGIVMFFLLEKAALWRHDHAHGATHAPAPQVPMIVLGDGLHNFVDGVLIAAAFMVDVRLGWVTTLAVLAHELPQEIGDFMVLLAAGLSKARALALNALSGAAMFLGGLLGYLALASAQAAIPYVIVLAAASFIYIAVADLVPELHRRRRFADAAAQLALLLAGVVVVQVINHVLPHAH